MIWQSDDAVAGDAADVVEILGNWVAETPWMPKLHSTTEDLWFANHLIASQKVRVTRAPEVVGFLAQLGPEVNALYLAPRARGAGIGRALLDEAKASEQDRALWTFQANVAALRFYKCQGFVVTEYTDGEGNAEHLPDVRLVWQAVTHG